MLFQGFLGRLLPQGQLPRRNIDIIPYRRVWRKGAVEKKSSREAAKEGLRGVKPLVATNAQVPRDECSRWSRPMMRFVATNRMFRRDQFNVSSRQIKTNVATNQLTPRRGLFVVSSGMKTSKIAAPRSSAATGRMEKDGYKKKPE